MQILLIATAITALLYLLLILWYWWGWVNLDRPIPPEEEPALSILIPVRNEAANIQQCLDNVLAQDYNGELEIIVLDDFSEDETADLVKAYPKVSLVSMAEELGEEYHNQPNKKRAITIGVGLAKNEIIVCTDGDCYAGPNWLSHLAANFRNKKVQFVTGPVLFEEGNSLLSKYQELELLSMAGITGATIANGKPLVANGANMAFRKKAFQQVKGFTHNDDLPTGDDVFLMNKIHRAFGKEAVAFAQSIEAVVLTTAQATWHKLTQQRLRWLSKGLRMNNTIASLNLSFVFLVQLATPLLFVYALVVGGWAWLAFAQLALTRLFTDFLFTWKVAAFFNKRKLLPYFLPVQFLYLATLLYTGIMSLSGRYQWKGRQVRK